MPRRQSAKDAATREGWVSFRFYEELNDFLPPARRGRSFVQRFRGPVAVKDVIEALGVPHTEIDLVLANGRSVRFTYRLRDGDRLSVYPVFEAFDISPLLRLRPKPLRRTRFVLDAHLGRLARNLRLLGFDSLYRNDYDDAQIAALAATERRIVLTRDVGLLKRSAVTHGYFLRHTDPQRQLQEVLLRFDLRGQLRPFTRWMRCNSRLRAASKTELAGHVKPEILRRHRRFRRCTGCGQAYWPGSHHERLRASVDRLTASEPPRVAEDTAGPPEP